MVGYWISFGLLFPIIFFGAFGFKAWSKRFINDEITPEMEKAANTRTVVIILFYWLCNLFYMACFINNLICKFVFGILIVLWVFMNLAMVFTNPKERNGFEKFGILQDFVVGIGLSIYLIFVIPNKELQQVVIPIVAAVYGGLITLVGVTLTIRKADNDRKAEEISKAKPVVFVCNYRNTTFDSGMVKILESKKAQGTLKKASEKSKNKYSLRYINLENSDYSIVSLVGFMINDDCHFYDVGQILPKNTRYRMNSDFEFEYNKKIKTVSLIIQDMLHNLYEFETEFDIDESNRISIKSGIEMHFIGKRNGF